MNGGFVKIYGSLVFSSVWRESKDTKILWVTMLALADPTGFVEGSVSGIAHVAGLTREECVAALAALSAPDPDSKTPDNEGRRIEAVPRGWRILNYEMYREMRTRSQDEAARRQRESRARRRDGHEESQMSQEVTDASASASPSSSGSASENQKTTDSPQGERPGVAKLAAFMAANDFGPFRDLVEGYIRASKSSMAVMATFEMHLTGEMGHERATAKELGLALQQYIPQEEGGRFKANFFAGFIRKAKAQPERTARRTSNAAEDARIIQEKREAEQREQDQRDTDLLNDFERRNEERFTMLKQQADASVDKRVKGETRREMVRGALIALVRAEVR